jgi:two-component system, OmpR family, response regulator
MGQNDEARTVVVASHASVIGTFARELAQVGIGLSVSSTMDASLDMARAGCVDLVAFDVDLVGRPNEALFLSLESSAKLSTIALLERDNASERASWLEAGADDCQTVPCEVAELKARFRAVVRRIRTDVSSSHEVLEVGALRLTRDTLRTELDGKPIKLTSYEFLLLWTLAVHHGQVLTREQLLDRARGSAEVAFDRSIDVQVSRLRNKLHDDPRQPRLLKTVRGSGYMLAL